MALRIGRVIILALRIKLKCFGVPVSEMVILVTDNESLHNNVSNPELILSKKNNETFIMFVKRP